MKFGFEPTFTNRRMEELWRLFSAKWENDEEAKGQWKRYRSYQDQKRVLLVKGLRMELGPTKAGKNRYSFRETHLGAWRVSKDVGIIEIQPPPQKLKTILSQMRALFRASTKAGLTPEIAFAGVDGGGGHIHLDKGVFAENPLLLRNFLVDIHNRPFLQVIFYEMGEAEDDAESIRERGEEPLFKALVAEFDWKWRRRGGRISLKKTRKVFKPMYYYSDKYRDVNLGNLVFKTHPPTVEIRMHRAQRAPEDFQDLAEFWLYRLANLSLVQEPIPILNLDQETVYRMRLPSVATRLWRELVRKSGLPSPERYERFAQESFPSPLRLGPPGKPSLEIRYARPHGNNGAVYEVLVPDPAIQEIRMGPALKRVRLSEVPELPGRLRIGTFIYHGAQGLVPLKGVPGVRAVDLSQARKEIEAYQVRRWRRVR